MQIWKKFYAWTDIFFPEINIYVNRSSVRAQIGMWLGLAIVLSVMANLVLPDADGYYAFDWVNFFGRGYFPPYYPPWGRYAVALLNWPTLAGISLAAVGLAAYKRARHFVSTIFVFLTLPLFWTLFIGQLDGLAVLGLLGLPWLAPLALTKPQIAISAFGARRIYLVAGIVTLLISFMIWGLWPLTFNEFYWQGEEKRFAQDIALFLWGIPVALPLFWFSRGDMDMMMIAGTFIAPHLIPFNLIVVVPAIARLNPWAALVTSILSWLPFSANWLGDMGWWLGWLFIAWLWGNLAWMRYRPASIMIHAVREN